MRITGKGLLSRLLPSALLCLMVFPVNAADKLRVYTVNYPLQYFAQRIAGEQAEVVFPVPADVDPVFWKPDASTIRQYQQADLILLNGAGYAKWVDKVSLPRRRLVNTSASFAQAYISVENTVTHSHGPGGDHSHAGTAFTTWLDLYQAVQQAESIRLALERKRPQHKVDFERNFQALKAELMALDLDIQKLSARHPGKPLFVSHPVYQYFARRYQLHLQSLVWEADEMPADEQWRRLTHAQENFPALWMIWESQPLEQILSRLRSLDIQAVVFDPCANRPEQGDFMSVMRNNIDNLRTVFQ